MAKTSDRKEEWMVSIPFSDLYKLINQLETMDLLSADNARLRREMDGMRNMFTELQAAFGELRRELMGR